MAIASQLRPAITMVAAFTALLGVALPLGFVGGAQLLAPSQAGGSMIERHGQIVGSALIGQNFTSPRYFRARPSATTAPDPKDATKTVPAPDNADNSSPSNLGPTSQALIDRVKADVAGRHDVPADAVTTSASGLDPDISPENAESQVARVAAARGIASADVAALLVRSIEGRAFGVFGEPHVNVLKLNLALDALPATVSH